MRPDWVGTYSRDQLRDVSFVCWPTVSWSEIIAGKRVPAPWEELRWYYPGQLVIAPDGNTIHVCLAKVILVSPNDVSSYWTTAGDEDYALPAPVDYTNLLDSASQGSQELTFNLVQVSASSALPAPGDLVGLLDNVTDQILYVAQVETIDAYNEQRGTRTVSGTARSRDAGPLWRAARWTSELYPVGTEISAITVDLLKSLRLQPDEYARVAPTGRWTPHTNNQLGDLTAWEMLSTLLFPTLQQPFLDALGRFAPISRDVRRDADFVLTEEDVVSRSGSRAGAPTTSLKLAWLDYRYSKSIQQVQPLGQGQVHAGYFARYQHVRIYWSKDRKQRAENTFMKILQSANGAEISFCTETYEQVDPFHGRVTVETDAAVPAIIVATIATAVYGLGIGDEITIATFTIRVGSLITDVALLGLAAIMRQVGTGTYEVWGQPYDYVHAVNRTEAYVRGSRPWETVVEEAESDFIFDEAHAQQVAVAECLYRHLAASRYSIQIVDRPELEPGDILLLPEGLRFYCTDYRREIRRGAPAVLNVEGFRV